MCFRAAVFDLDGTLLDTIADLAASMNAVLAGRGYPLHDHAAYKMFVGIGVEHLARSALPEDRRSPAEVAECVSLMAEEYSRRRADETRPYPGVTEMLDGLEALGVPMAVLSNKPHDFTVQVIKEFFPGRKFLAVFGARPDVPKKPHPKAALEAAADLGVPPETIVFLGDTATDIETAKAAGMYPAGALWGFRSAEELEDAGAEVLLDNPLKLLDFFQ